MSARCYVAVGAGFVGVVGYLAGWEGSGGMVRGDLDGVIVTCFRSSMPIFSCSTHPQTSMLGIPIGPCRLFLESSCHVGPGIARCLCQYGIC